MNKPPAFQLYASDFDMDTGSWTAPQVGVYVRLLLSAWVNGGIPNNTAELARIARIDTRTLAKMWKQTLAKKWELTPENMYVNPRMEVEREKQSIYRESQRIKGEARSKKMWEGHIAAAKKRLQPKDSSSSSSSTSIKTINKQKIVFEDGKFKNIPDSLIEKWKQVAPGVNVIAEIPKAELWVISNPDKGRSKWTSFLSNWMVRAQDNFIKYGGNSNVGIRTSRSDPRDKNLQSREDAEIAAITAKWEAAKKTTLDHSRGTAGNNDAPDFTREHP